MMSRRRIVGLGFSLLLIALTPLAPARAADAVGVVTDFGNRTLQMLNDPQISQSERQKRFGAALDQDFDFPRIGRFVLGRYWANASDEEKRQFASVFRDYVVQAYTNRFSDFTGASFKVTGQRPESDTTAIVSTTVSQRNAQNPAKVDWRVAKSDDGYRITEVIVEGISMSLTHRQEFASIIEKNGGKVADLIAQLRQKINIAKQ
jgi:phospholipid transport system substrate-binding protein